LFFLDKLEKTAFFERGDVTTVINSVCSADSFDVVNNFLSNGGIEECKIDSGKDLVIWTLHFTSFGTFTISSTSGTSGGTTVGTTTSSASFFSEGNSGGGGVISSGSGGIITGQVHLYKVTWDKCDENVLRIVAGPSDENLSVKLRTVTSGLVEVNLAEVQPYDTKLVYEAKLDSDVTFVQVQVEGLSSSPSLAQKSFDLRECEGSVVVYSEPEIPILPVIEQSPLIASLLEKISPRNQIALGIAPDSVICREGLELIFKASNGSPACVTPETFGKLVQRGWGGT